MSLLSRTRHHRETPAFRRTIKALARVVRMHRRERGWSVEEAAARFGVEPAFVRRIEAGRTNPSIAVLVSVASAFGLTAGDLFATKE
jgi:transcriptional regulator with XRE-family HTH domain